MRYQVIGCAAVVVAVLSVAWGQQASGPARQPAAAEAKPATATSLPYCGQGPYQLVDRSNKTQGLHALLSRGRVAPEDLLAEKAPAPNLRVRSSSRTIFPDQYTGAEVWRLTDFTSGVVRHTYSGVPAWNANGRYIQLEYQTFGAVLWDQETGTQTFGPYSGAWSPTEPNMLFRAGQWQGNKAVIAFDIEKRQEVRGLAPVRTYAGVAPVSADGKWVCWREGTQDVATTFGLAATDGSAYKSIATNGGTVTERTPVSFDPLPEPPSLDVTRGGIHQMYFTRRPDHSVITNVHGDAPHARLFTPDGKQFAGFENFTHQSWQPQGQYVVYMKAGVVALDPISQKQWPILNVANAIEGHTSWNSFDPNWLGMSYRARFGGEIIRVSMRPDRSVVRLCDSCPLNPDTTAYNNDEFACLSPDGTKVLFMSTMSGSVNEYLVVAANPRPPKLKGEWTDQGYRLTIVPDALSREAKGYRLYQTGRSGQDYRLIGFVEVPVSSSVAAPAPIDFLVKDLQRGQEVCFAARAQEWSGLLSRYSNDVSAAGKPVALYIEPESLEFAGFMQGFDPRNASDSYYLFVPEEGRTCAVTFDNPLADGQVWARVMGKDATIRVNGKEVPKPSDADWTWVNLGNVPRSVKIESPSAGFKLDRLFVTPAKDQRPEGRGLDYAPDTSFAALQPAGLNAKVQGPFAVQLTWQPVAGVRYYNLYASSEADFQPGPSTLICSPAAGTERALDWGLKPGTSYHYRVVAVDYDGTPSKPSASVEVRTAPLQAQSVPVEYESAAQVNVESDAAASGGKSILLDKGQTYQLTFTIPAEGDYVIWHAFRADYGREVRCAVKLDDKSYTLIETYDLTALGGRALRKDWIWSRYTFHWTKDANAILHLKAGKHALSLTPEQPIHLDQLIITNDQSFVPAGKLCTF